VYSGEQDGSRLDPVLEHMQRASLKPEEW
jgi:hypothetical protein